MSALSGWINTLGWTLLHFVWQGLLVGALYALAGLALARQRASVRYSAGLVTLLVLAALPVATFWYLAPGSNAAALDPVRAVLAPDLGGAQGAGPAAWVENWLPALVGFWMLGVVAFGTRYVAEYRRLNRMVREAAAPLGEWNERVRVLCARFGITRTVRLLQSAAVETPCLIGWIAPVIVLPASTLVGLTPAQVELVIAHELAHVRRMDYLVNALQIALETVLFYHPVVHWISRNVRHDREACCDDLVLAQGADPVVYARALANLEEMRDMPTPALAASGGFLLGRIRRIVGLDPVFAMPRTVPLGVLVLLLAAAALISQRQLSQPLPALTLSDAPVALLRALHPAKPAVVAAPAVQERATLTLPELLAPSATPQDAGSADASTPVPARPAFAPARPQRPEALAADRIGDLAVAPQRSLTVLPGASAAPPFAVHRVAPVFPQRARIVGIEGRVTLGFSVDRAGQARDIRVLEATPLGEFESAATQALREWRFNPAAVVPGQRYTQVFDFALAAPSGAEGESDADCRFPMGSRICRRDLPPADLETGLQPNALATAPR